MPNGTDPMTAKARNRGRTTANLTPRCRIAGAGATNRTNFLMLARRVAPPESIFNGGSALVGNRAIRDVDRATVPAKMPGDGVASNRGAVPAYLPRVDPGLLPGDVENAPARLARTPGADGVRFIRPHGAP